MDKAFHRFWDRANIIYAEKHHRIPKALGGDNDRQNLVRLTAREHLIAHRLLIRMTTGQNRYKMISALWAMCNLKSKHTVGRIPVTGRAYETARKAFADKASATTKGIPKTEEHRRRIGLGNMGKVLSQETRAKLSQSKIGKTGAVRTAAQKMNYAASKTGRKNPAARACEVDGIVYHTLSAAGMAYGLSRRKIKQHPGFKFCP